MTNNQHGQVPEALRIADEFKLCSEFDSIPSIIDIEKAEAELRRQHTRIAELEAEVAAVGAGGVQALSAAPEAIAKLRHLYQNMVNGTVRDTASAKRIAEGLLSPAIEALERATPPAEQPIGEVVVTKTKDGQIVSVTRQDDEGRILSVIATSDSEGQRAEESRVKLLAECRDAFPIPEPSSPLEVQWAAAMARPEEVPEYVRLCVAAMQAAPKAAPATVSRTQHSQFLSDVLTAAGLITHGKQCKALGERLADMVMRLREAPQQEAQGPFAWESTTPGYIKYITQAQYEKFSPNVQRWYKPYKCSSCAAPQQEAQEPVAWLSPWRADQVTTDYDAYGERGIPLYTAPQPAPAPPSEREAFEAWIKKDGGDLGTFGTPPNMHYRNSAVNNAWVAWKARAALAAQEGE